MSRPYRPATSYTVAAGSTSAASSAGFRPGIKFVRVCSTVAAYITFGATPTATATSIYIPANFPEVFEVQPGDKIAALQVGSAGTVSVTELTR